MIGKLAASIIAIVSLFAPVSAAAADILPTTGSADAVTVSEIYSNAPGSPEIGEFIELFNPGELPVDLTGYVLYRKNTTFNLALDGLMIEAGGYLSIEPGFALVNGGGAIVLDFAPDKDGLVLSSEIIYPSLDELHSWSLVGEIWQAETPSPGLPNPEPVEEETIPEEPAACEISGVTVSEILANPAGSDSNGNEFVEFYNSNDEPVLMTGCLLTTDKISDFVLPDMTIGPRGYFAVGLADKLLNNGGRVWFITHGSEEIIEYPGLGDDEAWAMIDNAWQVTELSTAGAANAPTPSAPEENDEESLAPCPEGKFRNPATNRCKNIVTAASALLPCPVGQVRNPLTNRCRRVTTAGSNLSPCLSGYARNPATNRCRRVAGANTSLTPCQPGYERNPETNRCRKAVAALSGTAAFPVSGPAPLHNGILISVSLLALLYGIYEYRLDITNWHAKLRERFAERA